MTALVRSVDGTSIAYETAGNGPALILVDAAGCFRGFGPNPALAAALASDFTVVTYDRRGRGESSDTLPYAVDREVDDVEALIEAVGGSAFVHGFSSGAVLALHAAVRGLPITKLALLEPPVHLEEPPPDEPDLGAGVAELVAAGRRGDAVEHFNRSIGVPDEMMAGLREHPAWPSLEALAHTLAYDTVVTSSLRVDRLSAVDVRTLVIDSQQSDDRLHKWARGVADALPAGRHLTLPGEWHGVSPDILAPALTDFFR